MAFPLAVVGFGHRLFEIVSKTFLIIRSLVTDNDLPRFTNNFIIYTLLPSFPIVSGAVLVGTMKVGEQAFCLLTTSFCSSSNSGHLTAPSYVAHPCASNYRNHPTYPHRAIWRHLWRAFSPKTPATQTTFARLRGKPFACALHHAVFRANPFNETDLQSKGGHHE